MLISTFAAVSGLSGPLPRIPRVLYVDDYPDLADSAVWVLTLLGVEARAAYDGPSALAVAAEFLPDVCFIDLYMPGMDGDELAGKLVAQAGARPVLLVAVTAMGDASNRGRLAAAGFHLHFIKPVDPLALLSVLSDQQTRGGALPPPLPADDLAGL
jgi:two-component system OmpR family response regulator